MQDIIMNILSALGGLGIASLLNTYLKERNKKSRYILDKKLEIYSDMLMEYHNHVGDANGEEREQQVVYQNCRMKLIAPTKITEISDKFFREPPEKSPSIREELVKAMREDLGAADNKN